MNRNIFSYLLLLGMAAYLLHEITQLPYIMAFVVIAPLAVTLSFITIPPMYVLLRMDIIDHNYDAGNVSIVVAIVEIIIVISLFQYVRNLDFSVIPEYIDLYIIGISMLIDVIAFFREYSRRWIYILVGAHIAAFGYIMIFFEKVDIFFIQIALYYLLVHTIFTVSYILLRHIIKFKFPYVSKYKV